MKPLAKLPSAITGRKADCHVHVQVVCESIRSEAFVEAAIDRGLETIVVTDHCPIPVAKAADRIPDGRLDDYIRGVRDLADRYRGRIDVVLGIEIDYHPQTDKFVREMLADHEFEYVVGSSHLHLGFTPPERPLTLDDYASLSLEVTMAAVESGLFHAIGHFDYHKQSHVWARHYPLVKSEYHPEKCEEQARSVMRRMAERGVLFEINSGGLNRGPNEPYPSDLFVQWSRDYDLRYVFGSDAHAPEHVGYAHSELMKKYADLNWV